MTDKIVNILEAIAETKGVNSITVLQKLTGIPRSSVHRMLQNMERGGMVVYIPDKGYTISQKLQYLCLTANQNSDFLEVMIPYVKAISEETRETVSVNVINEMQRLCIYSIYGSRHAVNKVRIGETGPRFKGSTGRVLVSNLSGHKFEEAMISAKESGVITDGNKDEIMARIEECRRDGYSVSVEERFNGCWSVAVPVISSITKECKGALSINGVITNYSEEVKNRYLKLLLDAAMEAGAKILL